ncbi:MAG: glycine oxidase ThiO [Polyangiales bacterium]
MRANADILVLGAGVVGCTVAWELASRHGAKVTVLERAVPGAEASSAAAGILGAQIESHDAPPPGPGPRRALFDLLIASRERHRLLDAQLLDRVGVSTGFRACGAMRVTRDPRRLQALVAGHLWQREHDQRVTTLDAKEAHALEPALAEEIVGGVHLADDAQLDPPSLLRALQLACVDAGVVFESGATVRGVVQTAGRISGVRVEGGEIQAPIVIVCAGSWSSMIDGLPLAARAVRPVRGQIVQVDTRPPIVKRIVFGDAGYLLSRADGRTLLGSTMEEAGHVKEVTVGGIHAVLGYAIATVPGIASAPITATWSGFRPATQRDTPIIGATKIGGLFIATGHFRNGILLAAETARLVADLVATGRCDRDLSPFAID